MTNQAKARVMIADDNAFVRFLMKRWLGDFAEVIEIANGKEVMPAYKAQRCDIVFLDIHLPGMSGKDILKDLRREDPDAYVIMLSADSNKDNVIETAKIGAKAFITKPFMRETLNRYYNLCPTVTPLRTSALAGKEEGSEAEAEAPAAQQV